MPRSERAQPRAAGQTANCHLLTAAKTSARKEDVGHHPPSWGEGLAKTVRYSLVRREVTIQLSQCRPLRQMAVKRWGLINRCDLPHKKLQTVIELVLIVLSAARWVQDHWHCDNSLIWRRYVNISKRPITVGGDERNISLFEVVIFAESIPTSSEQQCRVRTYTGC